MSPQAEVKQFFEHAASQELTLAIKRSVATATTARRHIYLATVVLELLQDQTVIDTVPELLRSKATGILREQHALLLETEPSTFAFKLDALVEPARQLSHQWGGSKTVSPLAFLATCLNPALPLDQESQRTRELLRAAGLTLESLMPGQLRSDLRRQEFKFESLGFGTDLTAKAAAGVWQACPLVGMEAEIRKVVKVLNSQVNSVVLTGEAGVGKSAVVEGFAYKIVHKDRAVIPPNMYSYTIVLIEAHDILQSAGVVGGLERELKRILAFFRQNPTVIPFFDEIHRLLDTGDDSLKGVATALKPAMANGLFRCIGATTNREYAQFIANDLALRSRLQQIQLLEPTATVAETIIEGSTERLLEGRAKELGITVRKDAISAAVNVTNAYQRTEHLPRKAIRLLQLAISEKVYAVDMGAAGEADKLVCSSDVVNVFSEISGIPVDALDSDRANYYRLVGKRIGERVIGQTNAIEAVVRWLSLQANGWVDQRRPRGRFVFVGPPGVGKTELARGLAEELMRDPESLIVLDMGDYQDEMALSKFMGASPGYIGFGSTPTVYTRVMTRPYSVVVFDEIEKAHSSLANPLLSILDGWAEDSRGNRVDFSQTIIIMTSNSLTGPVEGGLGGGREAGSDQLLRAALRKKKGIWGAPLLDRVDRVCQFRALGDDVLASILDLQIEKRRVVASKPLPASVYSMDAKRTILATASEHGGEASARRLERALLDWLSGVAFSPVADSGGPVVGQTPEGNVGL